MAWIISRLTVRTGAENALGAVAQVQRVSHSQGQQQQEGVTNNSASSLTNTVEIASLEKNASFCTLAQVARDHTQHQNAGLVARRRWAGWTKLNSTGHKDPQLFDSHILYCSCCYSYSMLLNANCAGSDNGLWSGIG